MRNPSQYGGVAAVFVFGVGLLLIGKTAAGILVLSMGTFVLACTLASTASARALVISIGALVCGAVLGYHAAANELSGTATYLHGIGRGSRSEPVTRAASPSKFREATNLLWGFTLLCAFASAGTFVFYRKAYTAENYF
jgi:hypothetical protein